MIVLVCGPPASGKTTLAARLRRRLEDRGHAFRSLHSDDYGRRPYERMYEDVAATYDGARTGGKRANAGRNWLLDGTFYRREWRNRFYRLDDVYEVWVRASLAACLERNRDRDDSIPEAGVRAIYGEFEPPRADLEIDTEAVGVEAAADRAESAVLGWIADADRP